MARTRRAVILAAGSGSRLQPFTNDVPKTLLHLDNNLTIFDRIALSLLEVEVKEVVVIAGHASSTLESHISNHTSKLVNNKIHFKIIRNEYLELGNIFSLWLARNEMKEDFLLFDSDVVFHHKILELLMADQHDSAIVVDDTKQNLGQDQSKVIISNAKIVKDIGKTINALDVNGEYTGIMKISANEANLVMHMIHRLLVGPIFPQYYTYPFRLIAKESDYFSACSTRGLPWIEIDTIKDLHYATNSVIPFVEKRVIQLR